jgi:hypothetical protein
MMRRQEAAGNRKQEAAAVGRKRKQEGRKRKQEAAAVGSRPARAHKSIE